MNFAPKTPLKQKLLVLLIMDGLGVAPPDKGNAVNLANTKNLDYLWPRNPHGYLYASGTEVGLPYGVPGNSEVCHLNIGAGKIVIHDLPRIDQSIVNGDFYENKVLNEQLARLKANPGKKLHLIGLLGNGFTHSSINHWKSLLRLLHEKQVDPNAVLLHVFTDGRDSGPRQSHEALEILDETIDRYKVGKLVSLVGRYYAMDRDDRWDRTELAYNLLTDKSFRISTKPFEKWDEILKSNYEHNITDEFIRPSVLADPNEFIQDGDFIISVNFRSDRMLQLISALANDNFEGFERKNKLNLDIVTFCKYGNNLDVEVAFPNNMEDSVYCLAKVISDNNLNQLHIAESEKFPHVTYFFNSERREPYTLEDWVEVPSPREVPTYDLKPEMSAYQVTDRVITEIDKNKYQFILVNLANPDMVGHTGVLDAGIRAVEVTDECVGRIVEKVKSVGGTTIITADHGNVEEMINMKTGEIDTQHSINPVPFMCVGAREDPRELRFGRLADIAPTILNILKINIPNTMTGRDLLN